MLPALYKLSSLRFWLARNARAYTSARSIGFCVIWVCISSSSSTIFVIGTNHISAPADAILGVWQAFFKTPTVTKIGRDETVTQLLEARLD